MPCAQANLEAIFAEHALIERLIEIDDYRLQPRGQHRGQPAAGYLLCQHEVGGFT